MKPTDEQVAILDTIRDKEDNLIINAYAGTGKTSTLGLVQEAAPQQPVLCLAFNKRIAEEMEKRFPPTTTVRTFNGLGHRIWMKTVAKISLDPKKTQMHLKLELDDLKGEDKREASEAYWDIISAVGMAKSLGYVPDGKYPHAKRLISQEQFYETLEERPSPLVEELIDSILLKSIKTAYEGFIDFNDQIYMPALFGGTFPRFPLVLVDEVQDLNPTNFEMLYKLVRGRLGAVGDDFQSIYAFRGAVQGGMGRLKQKFSMHEQTISISFRCPRVIVEAARWRVPEFKWFNDGGHYEVLKQLSTDQIPEGAAIICRNNAPLFRAAFGLLSAKRSVHVAGSDIGPKLISIMKKLGDDSMSKANLKIAIENWRDAKLEKSQSPDTIHDMTECMMVFSDFGNTLGQAIAYADHLFKQQGAIKLLTGHKAKGLEFDVVYHLDPWLIGRHDEQEMNLRYVITTRAKQSLYEINSKDIAW